MDQGKEIKKIKRIEAASKKLQAKWNKLFKEYTGIRNRLNDDTVRQPEVTEEVIAIRQKILRDHPEISVLMERYQIPIDHVALVRSWYHPWCNWDNPDLQRDIPKFEPPRFMKDGMEIVYGGLKDPMQIRYRRVREGCYKLNGLILSPDGMKKMKKSAEAFILYASMRNQKKSQKMSGKKAA